MMKKVRGNIRAGYMYTVLPAAARNRLLDALGRRETARLNAGVKEATGLPLQQRKKILSEFVASMRGMEARRASIIDNALLTSLATLCLFVLVLFLYALTLHSSTGRIIDMLEAGLAGGGMHLAFFPYAYGYIRATGAESPLVLLLRPGNFAGEILLAIGGSIALVLILALAAGGTGGLPRDPLLAGITCIVSATVGPALEELLFRYLFFLRPGRRHGYLACGIASSVAFAAVHLPDTPLLAAAYLLSGGVLCALSYYGNKLFPAFIAHAGANVVLIFV